MNTKKVVKRRFLRTVKFLSKEFAEEIEGDLDLSKVLARFGEWVLKMYKREHLSVDKFKEMFNKKEEPKEPEDAGAEKTFEISYKIAGQSIIHKKLIEAPTSKHASILFHRITPNATVLTITEEVKPEVEGDVDG